MDFHQVPEKQTRRRSRTVSWDHSVRADGEPLTCKTTTDRGVLSPQGITSPGPRDSSTAELFFDDDMSISRGHSVEKVRFSASRAHSDENDEDYSASVNAILHKRLSVRKGKHLKQRRSSSPVSSMLPDDASLISDRRRSSAFTTSSGDTAINIEEAGISQEQIFENIRLHKEVLGSVRQQPWSIRRKMKLVQQAKEYVKKHEGQLQERLAMSKSTRDIMARFHIVLVKQWQHSKREMANFISQIIPWELTIKEIESQFGTVVASYFTFLRWLFWVNFVISVLLAAFVVMPEILTTNKADTGERKTLLPEEQATSMELMTLLNFEGVLQHSPMFYGYYSNRQSSDTGYRLPTAYFITGLVVYIYSFVATLRKMAANSRLSKLSEKDDECIFTWKLFTGWDYMIGNEETAHNRISSIILGFKEALLEEAERMKDKQNWKVVALRIFANLNMVWMLGSSVYAVILVVARSTEPEAEATMWRKYEITVVMTLIGTFFPIAFEVLGVLESYHPRTTLRVQLARIMALNLLNLYTLTFALFVKINDMTKELLTLKSNVSNITANAATRATAATAATIATAATMATTTSMLKTTSTTSVLVALAFMNSTMSNMTKLQLPVTHTIDTQPNCYRQQIECPFSWPGVQYVTADIHSPKMKDYISSSIAPLEFSTTGADFSSVVGLVSGADFGQTTGVFGANRNGGTGWTESTAETTFKTIDDLRITAEVIYDDTLSSSEDNATTSEFDVSSTHSYDETTEKSTVGLVTAESMSDNSTVDTVDDWSTTTYPMNVSLDLSSIASQSISSSTQSAISETIPGEYVESTSSVIPESTASLDAEILMLNTTIDQSIITMDNDDEQYSTIVSDDLQLLRTDEIIASSEKRRIVKRMSEVIFNGTHCFQVVCSSPSPVTNVTEVPNSSQGFSEESTEEYVATTEHEDAPREDLSLRATCLNLQIRRRLRKLCWETMFGQELVKLTVMDLVSTIISTIFVDFARAVFVRYMNRCWCWNLEKRFPQYGDFKIAENILHLVNNQGMVWMGMFFSPGLPIINVVKLMIMMYVRSWAVLTCNVPHDVVFRASRSNNFYLGLLLTMLFLCVLPVGYAIVWIEPSWHCGPFSQYKKIYHIFTNSIKKTVPNPLVHRILDYIASPAIVIPLLLLLILIIYYLASLTSSLREANNDLKTQLRRERTEERRKMFQLVNRKKHGSGVDDDDEDDYTCMDTTLAKWRHIMPDSKTQTDVPSSVFEIAEKKLTDSEVLDRVREKLVHIEAEDQQPENKHHPSRDDQQQQQQTQPPHIKLQRNLHHHQPPLLQHHHHHHHHHQQHLYHHLRRPSKSEEPRDTAATLRKWKKSKVVRHLSSESESSDQSEAVPETREPVQPQITTAASHGSGLHHRTTATELLVSGAVVEEGGSTTAVDQPVKQKARLKLAQILYKEARRRRQKYVEELQNQQE
ncbi:transmembrane channel-like protein isoform X1 [Rhopalosiphum padi]|uniref:transmembrane channel-like protein isoform X1 n=2 Tax=Rhopalosiphum padi TaxID=40932 RepID=UPI00298D7487|nr:transmembrane channel-like protein isoform X1 [Rhopalosiphum padi]XP_060852733.1 transmembrane channel-like protein isoform X1 [Rhopalosiphum padi]